ncbi:hypothetical protein DPEC_G00025440 [Dallia pectoralis]|uniref:Uncharacterized protein n=1 Tax=Dallia pectoralis TaxID=75939 RepID=A0ACC2HHA4_DALPE|nr:hypothetical protein DPEC_G00025440 [Dallia pectoralis]
MTRLSLLGTLSNYLLRPELEELEDGGMAELLTINDNLSQLMGITVKDSDPGAMREENKLGDVRIVQRERPESGKSAAELGPSRHISPATVQNAGDRQTYVDHGSGYSPHTSQRQINSTWRKDFKISGLIGDPGQKDRLSFSSLARQIESGLNKDYSEQEIVDSVIRAITPGLQLRSYLEGKVGLTLPVLRRILRSHYQEKNATELYKQLTTEAQRSRETPQSFLIRAFDLRQKVLFASQEDDSGLRYDPALVQNMFLHTVLTGLQSDRVQSDLQTCLSDPTVPDEVLLEKLNIACSHESERQNKRKTEKSGTVHAVQLSEPAPEQKVQPKPSKFDLMSQLKSLSDEIMQIKETMQQPLSVPQQCFAAYNKEPTAAVSPQHQISTQGSRQTSGWTVQEHQTWKPDTATCSQQAGPCMPPHQPSQSQNQWREQDILLTPAKLAQCPSGPQEQYLQSSQRYVVPETHHGQPYGFPSPQQHPMPISYATHPSSFTTSQYYPQQYMAPPQPHPYQFRQTRPSRARQCFHCQRRKAEEPCTHCYRCGSNEHFLAGCKEEDPGYNIESS